MSDRIVALRNARVVAVLRGPSKAGTVRAVHALVAGGVTGIEVTYSTPDAAEAIADLHQQYGDSIVLGAGTVLTEDQATAAAQAGASFLVSPGTTAELAAAIGATGLVSLYGSLTPSEVLNALGWGADVVKLFPASLGGPNYLKWLRGPFPDVPFCPTGGVNPGTMSAWFDAGAVAVGAGSELCSSADIAGEKWATIEGNARAFAAAAGAP